VEARDAGAAAGGLREQAGTLDRIVEQLLAGQQAASDDHDERSATNR
jgi:hypothetical protein